LWNGILHEQQVLLLEFLSSSQLASAYEGIWKSSKLCFNVAVAHHVSIICVTRARYWEIAWELHSELCWLLPSNESTDSPHSWIFTLQELQSRWDHRLACCMYSWLLSPSQ
jgi:hypothetical protein